MTRRAFLGLVLATLGGCRFPAPAPSPVEPSPLPTFPGLTEAPAGKYVFVEVWVDREATGNAPGLAIDFPGYDFDPLTGRLQYGATTPLRTHPLAANDLGVLGTGESSRGNGTGISSTLEIIPGLPYAAELLMGTGNIAHLTSGGVEYLDAEMRRSSVQIRAVSSDGRLRVEVDGQAVVLAPGEKWERVVPADTGQGGRFTTTSRLVNYGWLERSDLVPWHLPSEAAPTATPRAGM